MTLPFPLLDEIFHIYFFLFYFIFLLTFGSHNTKGKIKERRGEDEEGGKRTGHGRFDL